jgi:hypothetical protein
VIIFVNSLYKVFPTLIGLKSFVVFAWSDFGSNTIWQAFHSLGASPVANACCIMRYTSGPIIRQFFWMNFAVSPSGPGDLSGPNRNITSLISLSVGIWVSVGETPEVFVVGPSFEMAEIQIDRVLTKS